MALNVLFSSLRAPRRFFVLCALCASVASFSMEAQQRIESQFRIARLKYSGGGDWYNDPSAEVNLLTFAKANAGIDADPKYEFIEISNDNFYSYPVIFITGHGNIS